MPWRQRSRSAIMETETQPSNTRSRQPHSRPQQHVEPVISIERGEPVWLSRPPADVCVVLIMCVALCVRACCSSSTSAIDRPHLIWVMNNLQVELKDREGNDLSTKAYIQSVLNEIDTTANSSTSYSKRFNRFFSSLDSFALPYPSSNFADASKLSDMTETQFTPEYREQRNTLKQRALSLVQPKRLGANMLVGAMLASLIGDVDAERQYTAGRRTAEQRQRAHEAHQREGGGQGSGQVQGQDERRHSAAARQRSPSSSRQRCAGGDERSEAGRAARLRSEVRPRNEQLVHGVRQTQRGQREGDTGRQTTATHCRLASNNK